MKPLPHSSDLLAVAPHVVWFEPAEKALADPIRFLAYLMTYGTLGGYCRGAALSRSR